MSGSAGILALLTRIGNENVKEVEVRLEVPTGHVEQVVSDVKKMLCRSVNGLGCKGNATEACRMESAEY